MTDNQLKRFTFQYDFRKHQKLIFDKFEECRNNNKSINFKFHLVSPPGSGKTVVGLEMAIRLGSPVLVVCPNTSLQGQWADKLRMFMEEGDDGSPKELVSINPDELKPVNIFTYQMLSVPLNDDDSFERISENLWAEEISSTQGIPTEDALFRIVTMKDNNKAAYRMELSRFNKKLRKNYLNDPEHSISNILHANTVDLIKRLKKYGIDTVIFDECHHLRNYWALVMKNIINETGIHNIIGLTATPPLDEGEEKLECYTALLGDVDYNIPAPAVIKEGMLAPYQDLVYFCTPTDEEYEYIRNCHQKFKKLIEGFDRKDCEFFFHIYDKIINRKLLSGEKQEWSRFITVRPSFAAAGVRYLFKNGCSLPWDITITEDMYEAMELEDWTCLIEDYALNMLKLRGSKEDMLLYDEIRAAMKSLGYILTEGGFRRHSSPLDRVLAYSRSKLSGVKEILRMESEALGGRLRAAIITDFETSNALSLKSMNNILDEECGGAVAVMKELTADPYTGMLDPVMVTAKSLLCDGDLGAKFIASGMKWARDYGLDIQLQLENVEAAKFCMILGSGRDWNSRTAVLLTTHLFEKGITKCLIGTRGILSEGWDSINLNTLIDLTSATTFTAVNQLRGRSVRRSESDPEKVSNNWDVVCIAPEMEKGYHDLDRLHRKHEQYYGVCDDGQIQKGINHVDPSIKMDHTSFGKEDMERINKAMLSTILERRRTYRLWKIGEPFDNVELGCCELKIGNPVKMRASGIISNEKVVLNNKIKSCVGKAVGTVLPFAGACAAITAFPAISIPVFLFSAIMGMNTYRSAKDIWNYGRENFFALAVRAAVLDIAKCLMHAMAECEMIDQEISEDHIVLSERSDGSIRVYLDGHGSDTDVFASSLSQIFMPIEDQRYAVQRYEAKVPEEGAGRLAYLFRYGMDKCEPYLAFYHPLPDLFNIKEKALVFKKYWNKYVSPGDVVFLKGENGREIIEKYGRVNFFRASKKDYRIWK